MTTATTTTFGVPAEAPATIVTVAPAAGKTPAEQDFDHPAWGQLRVFAIVHTIFEIIYIPLALLTTVFGFIWPMLVLIAAANVACKCCCTVEGSKCISTTMVVMNSIAFIGSFIDIAIYTTLQATCDAYGISSHTYCQYVSAALAWCIICLILRIVSLVLAGRIVCGCCGGERPSSLAGAGQQPAPVAMVAMPTTAAPTVVAVPPAASK